MTTHTWTQTMGEFKPILRGKDGQLVTDCDNAALADVLIADHVARSRVIRGPADYRVEDFSDELRIYVFSGGRWRILINLQYEGQGQ